MTPEQVQHIRASWQQLTECEDVAKDFYARLFEIDPSVRTLFKNDLEVQGKKLIDMLSVAVARLGEPEQLEGALRGLGQRHVIYGVLPIHYDVVGQALVETFSDKLGDDFTPEVKAAWIAVYTWVGTIMKEAAYPSAAA